jgi:release factor glutamine methyltransferase
MRVTDAFKQICRQLQTICTMGEAESIAYLVIEHYTGIKRMQMAWREQELLTPEIKDQVNDALNELIKHKPVQYVLGETWFYDLRFIVNEHVLIPRPETEELVHWIVNTHTASTNALNILEIGTGSGCIAIALKKALHQANITAIDISKNALEVARQNAADLQTTINFHLVDFLNEERWNTMPAFDIIVSNPPYIPLNEKAKMDANVAAWEPATALFVPDDDPLLFYKKIAVFGKKHLHHHAEIFVECHQQYAIATKLLFEQNGYNTILRKDIFDNNRMLRAGMMA